MKKNSILILLLFFILPVFLKPVFAQSSYVLPYPSFMPGNLLYEVNLIKERLLKYWYFGNFGQFKYNLRETDRYLVESKTLFEYNQYLLAYKSLQESDYYFELPNKYLQDAKKEGKDISQNSKILKDAAKRHIEVLTKIENDVPNNFVWMPEKQKSVNLNLKQKIENAIDIRKKFL